MTELFSVWYGSGIPVMLKRLAAHRSPGDLPVSLNEEAYRRIRAAIEAKAVGNGEPLSEARLARKLGISRTPVREALKRLAVEGLVEVFPRRGTFVRIPNMARTREIFQVREALEGMAARLATPLVDARELSEFRARIEASHRRNDAQEVFRVGRSFHSWIAAHCGNNLLIEYLTSLRSQIDAVFSIGAHLPGQMDRSYREYRSIMHAMKLGNADRAEAAMRRHIASVRNNLLST